MFAAIQFQAPEELFRVSVHSSDVSARQSLFCSFSYFLSSWHRPVSLWLWWWSLPRNSDPQPSALIALPGSMRLLIGWLNRGQGTNDVDLRLLAQLCVVSHLSLSFSWLCFVSDSVDHFSQCSPSASCFYSFPNQNSESRSWRRGWMPYKWAQNLWFWFVEHFI